MTHANLIAGLAWITLSSLCWAPLFSVAKLRGQAARHASTKGDLQVPAGSFAGGSPLRLTVLTCIPGLGGLVAAHLAAIAVGWASAFEGVDPSLLRRAPASFEGEGEDSRLARRKRHWIANVKYTEGDT